MSIDQLKRFLFITSDDRLAAVWNKDIILGSDVRWVSFGQIRQV